LVLGIWILFAICDLVLGISSNKMIFVFAARIGLFGRRFTTDCQHPFVHESVIPLEAMGRKISVDCYLSESVGFQKG